MIEGTPHPTCHVSCVMCHVSCVKCHVSCVTCRMLLVTCHVPLKKYFFHTFDFFDFFKTYFFFYILLDKVVKLVGKGSVINWTTLSITILQNYLNLIRLAKVGLCQRFLSTFKTQLFNPSLLIALLIFTLPHLFWSI